MIGVLINAAIDVHRALGPGLLDSVYASAMAFEWAERKIRFVRQVDVPVAYHSHALGVGFRADMVVDETLLLKFKAVDGFSGLYLAQVMTYLRLLNIKRGLLPNFNSQLLKDGIKRVSL